MTEQTKAILTPVLDGDRSISADERSAVFDILERRSMTPADCDWVLTRSEVAALFKCSMKSVSRYAQRGIIQPICLGAKGRRASKGYSGKSVMSALDCTARKASSK